MTLAWCFEDEAHAEAMKARALRDQIETGDTIIVPNYWLYEVHNALWVGERRGRIETKDTALFLSALKAFPIHAASPLERLDDLAVILEVSREHGLSVYDALYLKEALDHALPLATIDKAQAEVARKMGIKLVLESSH